jgi:hypothetical protein
VEIANMSKPNVDAIWDEAMKDVPLRAAERFDGGRVICHTVPFRVGESCFGLQPP